MSDLSSKADKPEALLRNAVLSLKPYHVPPAGSSIKLDAMENPNEWPGSLPEADVQAWLNLLQAQQLNRYPDAACTSMKQALRDYFGLAADAPMLVGNGSDELIQILIMAIAGSGRPVLAPEPSFVMYQLISAWLGVEFIAVPLRDGDFALDPEAMLAAIKQHDPALIFLAYPNNPTANLFAAEHIEAIIQASSGLVVIDEAYAAFAADSWLQRAAQWPNLLVLRTLSKVGLAGLRVGALMGSANWLNELEKLSLPYNINSLTQASVCFALSKAQQLKAQAEQIIQERAWLIAELQAIPGLRVWPSEANFILLQLPERETEQLAGQNTEKSATAVHAKLAKDGILIKNLSCGHPLLARCLRVTVGNRQENSMFLAAFQRLMA